MDQTDIFLPEDPPQYKCIAGITLPASYHSHWPANQDHMRERVKSSLAWCRKHTQLEPPLPVLRSLHSHSYLFLENLKPQPSITMTHISGIASSQAGSGPCRAMLAGWTPQASPAINIYSHTTTIVHTLMDDFKIQCEARDLVVCSASSL